MPQERYILQTHGSSPSECQNEGQVRANIRTETWTVMYRKEEELCKDCAQLSSLGLTRAEVAHCAGSGRSWTIDQFISPIASGGVVVSNINVTWDNNLHSSQAQQLANDPRSRHTKPKRR